MYTQNPFVRVPIKRHCAATERTETDVQCSSSTASGGLGLAAAAQITPRPMNERPLPGNAFRVLSTFASPPFSLSPLAASLSLPSPTIALFPRCQRRSDPDGTEREKRDTRAGDGKGPGVGGH